MKYRNLDLLFLFPKKLKSKFSSKLNIKSCIFLGLFFKCFVCQATVVPEPYFSSLTKSYDVDNKINLFKRKTVSGEVHVSEKKPVEIDSIWNDLLPELSPGVASEINQYQKNIQTFSFNANYQDQSNQLEKIKSNFIKHYIEKRVINGFVLKRIKESNASLSNVDSKVKSLSGQAPIEKAVVSADDEWQVDVGTRTDWFRQRSRAWFNCSLFNSEAKVDLGGFSRFNYELKISKSLVLNTEDRPFSVFHTALLVNNNETSSLIKTNISRNLELNYQSVFSRSDNIVQLNYNIGF